MLFNQNIYLRNFPLSFAVCVLFIYYHYYLFYFFSELPLQLVTLFSNPLVQWKIVNSSMARQHATHLGAVKNLRHVL
jgi:uncharacterized membrane protein